LPKNVDILPEKFLPKIFPPESLNNGDAQLWTTFHLHRSVMKVV